MPAFLIPNIILNQKLSETQRGLSTKYFSTVSQNIFDDKSWYLLFYLRKFFQTREFLKHRSVPLRKVSVLWDKTFSAKNRDTPPPTLLCIETFITGNFLKLRRAPLRNVSVLWDETILMENWDRCPPFLSQTFSLTRNFLKLREVCLPSISVLSVKTYSTTNRDTSCFIYAKFSKPEGFSSTEVFLYEKFRYCETKHFRQKIEKLLPPLSYA